MIVVCGMDEKSGVTWNLTRTSLTLPNDQDLPWGRWANEFVEKMPDELREYVNARLPANDADQFIAAKLKEFQNLLEIRRPVKDSGGVIKIRDASTPTTSPTHVTARDVDETLKSMVPKRRRQAKKRKTLWLDAL